MAMPCFSAHCISKPNACNVPGRQTATGVVAAQRSAKDAVLHGATHFRLQRLADQAEGHRQHVDPEAIAVCRANKTARKRLKRKAENWVDKHLKRIEAAVKAQQWRKLADLIDTFFRRHEAKYLAYVEARKSMKRRHRPHLYALGRRLISTK